MLEARLDYGWLGQAALLHARAHVGLALRGVEPFVGYDSLVIGPYRFHGPLLGLRVWAH